MIVLADGLPRSAWALREVHSGHILIEQLCEDPQHAHHLRAAMVEHAVRGHWQVVAVTISVVAVDTIHRSPEFHA